ncbi:MAG TPA: hypothetical protein GX706_04550 [Candidatus Moranbacteria bacterium]|nr:hypothetical protein [Bacillota bacterium]HHX59002.1 hypothetical protein [Candidatus Moranbacteria bacterium]
MIKFFNRLGFRRMDEMEMEISLKSLRWSSLFSGCALFALSVYEKVTTGELGWAFLIFILQYLVFWGAHHVLTRKMSGGKVEE